MKMCRDAHGNIVYPNDFIMKCPDEQLQAMLDKFNSLKAAVDMYHKQMPEHLVKQRDQIRAELWRRQGICP